MKRCAWAEGSPELAAYHDEEWGVPRYDEAILFEMLVLESFQAGLSWNLILRKRDAFRRAFDGFDPERIGTYGGREVARLLGDEGIVRSRAKIAATIANANAYLAMRDRGERLSELVWSFVDGEPIVGGRSGAYAKRGVGGAIGGAEGARLLVRRRGDDVLVHAGGRAGERPRAGLLPARGLHSRG